MPLNASYPYTTKNPRILECAIKYDVEVRFGLPEMVAWIAISVVTIIANITSIATLLKSKRRRTSHSIYLISLLASDLMIGAIIHPARAYACYVDKVPCTLIRIVRPLTVINISISLFSSLATAVGRLKALNIRNNRVLNSMQSRRSQASKTPLIVVAAIWLVSHLAGLSMVFTSTDARKLQVLFGFIYIAIVVLYLVITVKLQIRFRNKTALAKKNASYSEHAACVKLIGFILFNMLITWLPILVLQTLKNRFSVHIDPYTLSICSKLVLLGPTLDPLCYVLVRYISSRT